MVRENITTTFIAELGEEEKEFDIYIDAVKAEEKHKEEQLENNLRKYFPISCKNNCVDCDVDHNGQESLKFLDGLRCKNCHEKCLDLFTDIQKCNMEIEGSKWPWMRLVFMFTDFKELHNSKNDATTKIGKRKYKVENIHKAVKNWDNYQKEKSNG